MQLDVAYQSVVGNAVFFAANCWCSSIIARDLKKLKKLKKKAGSGAPASGGREENAALTAH